MTKINLAMLCLLLAATACKTSDVTYRSEKTKGIDYHKYRTYAFLPTKDTAYSRIANKKDVEKALARDVAKELDARGMVRDTTNPDCLFTYTLVLNKNYAIGQAPPDIYAPQLQSPIYAGQQQLFYTIPDYGPVSYSGGMTVTTYRDGSLIIDMVDRATNKVIWRTSAEATRDERDIKSIRYTASQLIPAMFKRFPIKKSN